MKIELKNVKFYLGMSEETIAFNASLYVDGKKVGDAKNRGTGGANSIWVGTKDGKYDSDLVEKMKAEAATHTWLYGIETHKHSLDSYISTLVDKFLEQRELKKKTLYRKPGYTYEEGEYHVVKRKYDESIKNYLVKTYGEGVEILNEKGGE